MDIEEAGLSASERLLVADLSRLAVDPSPEARAAIVAAVRGSQPARRTVMGRWRLPLAGFAAAAVLVGSTLSAFAASSDALPSSPVYSLRVLGEQVRIGLSGPGDREQLRISFANSRTTQAQVTMSHGDRSDASVLLRDSRGYLDKAKKDLGSVSVNEQGQVQNQLNQAQANEHQAEQQLNQEGVQGSSS